MIGVIALVSRAAFVQNVIDNFERQSHRDKLLFAVVNGPESAACIETLPRSCIKISSIADRSAARNRGLKELSDRRIDHFAFFEDDDIYEAEYLAEHWENRERADVLGKSTFVIQVPDDKKTRLLMFPGWEWRYIVLKSGFVEGGLAAATLFGRTNRAVLWQEGMPWGEEVLWYTDMLRNCSTLFSTSAKHFVRRRFADTKHAHATPIDWKSEILKAGAVELGVEEGL